MNLAMRALPTISSIALDKKKRAQAQRIGISRAAGFSLVEILLVLGLIATIAIGAFVIYPRVQASRDLNDAAAKHVFIMTSIRDFFGTRQPTGLTTTNAVSAGILEPEDLRSPWGGNITLSIIFGAIVVSYDQLTPDRCKKLVTRLEPQSVAITIDTTIIKNPDTAFNPLSIAACDGIAPSTAAAFWQRP